MNEKAKGGAPIYWTPEKKKEAFDKIINLMCTGISLNKILKDKLLSDEIERHPDYATFLDWTSKDTELDKKYVRAQEIRAEIYFDEIIEIADNQEQGTIEETSEKGFKTIKKDATEHRKIKIDSRKFAISRMNPKKFSDKLQIEQTEFIEQKFFNDIHTEESENEENDDFSTFDED